MQIRSKLSDEQISVLSRAEKLEDEAHKIRLRSGLPAALPCESLLVFESYMIFSTAWLALSTYWRIAKVHARKGEWGEYLRLLLIQSALTEMHLFRDWCSIVLGNLARQIQGRAPDDIRMQLESLSRRIHADLGV